MKALAILSKTRSPVEPNLPTALEQGLDVQAYTWNAACSCPRACRPEIVKKLNSAVVQAMNTPAVRDRLQSFGARRLSPTTAPRRNISADFVKSEIAKWAAPIKASGVTVK